MYIFKSTCSNIHYTVNSFHNHCGITLGQSLEDFLSPLSYLFKRFSDSNDNIYAWNDKNEYRREQIKKLIKATVIRNMVSISHYPTSIVQVY